MRKGVLIKTRCKYRALSTYSNLRAKFKYNPKANLNNAVCFFSDLSMLGREGKRYFEAVYDY